MASIENIKQNILQMEAGSFQNLCNLYLSKIGYSGIVSLGGEAGTQKTTLGTPDTYFTTSDGMYVFVEYTTQQRSLFAKIKDDLAKCLDTSKTGIPHNKISEIIYCHTSSNITPEQDQEVKTLCENAGIKLTVIGIDKLAEDLYLYHPIIARDYLGISISTDQIQSYDDFIRTYNAKILTAPIDTPFLFRDNEIDNISKAYGKVDIVILSGAAGIGKTRLALHYGKLHSARNNETLYCIHNNALPIYEDLKQFINAPGNYFLFIDDANQLSGLQHIIHYTTMKPEGYNVKILISVRDYALQKVKNDLREIAPYEIVNIKTFGDEEIKKLLAIVLNITNPDYTERIIRIAEGNARISILAGKIACDSQRLNSINDASQLYDNYYGASLEEHPLLTDRHKCITAGIVAFLNVIHLDYIDSFIPILEANGLYKDRFIEIIRMLHEQEIVDICNDKAVQVSDQCLSNYILKYVFFDKKLLSLSAMIKTCFPKNKERTVSSINTLLYIFGNDELYNYVEGEIKLLWSELSSENPPYFFEFVKAFYLINPIESLLILQDQIEREEEVIIESSAIDTETGRNYQNVTSDIIEILGGFADAPDLPTALDLFFQYYKKRPDMFMEFYHATTRYFSIKKNSDRNGYYTQRIFFEKIREHSENWKCESVTILFLEIVKGFLKLHFSPIEGGRRHTFTIHRIPLVYSEGVKSYRKLIWQALFVLCKADNYKEKIRSILPYDGPIEEISIPVMQFDLTYIEPMLKSDFPANELDNCLFADRLVHEFSSMNIPCESMFSEYLEAENFRLYKLLKGPDYSKANGYKEREKIKRQAIIEQVTDCDLTTFKLLIDVCKDTDHNNGHAAWQISEGLQIAFDAISSQKDLYIDAIEYYIKNDTPCNLHPNRMVHLLFSLLSDSAVLQLISSSEYTQKNAWLYAYYHELPSEYITAKNLQGLYDFLSDTSDRVITSSSFRDVDFIEKFTIVDKDALIKSCNIILAKIEYSSFMMYIYFDLLFNDSHNSPQSVIQKFADDLDLLVDIYFALLAYKYSCDYNGKFLILIYLASPSVLERYIDHFISISDVNHDYHEIHRCFFDLDNFLEIYNRIFERIVTEFKRPLSTVPYFLEAILLPVQNNQDLLNKQDIWIKQCIQLFANDPTKMFCLFSVISKFEAGRKKEYILLYLEYNPSFEDFERIPLTPTSYGWTGSAIPVYSAWIEFLETLLPHLTGLIWLKHKNHIVQSIDYWRKQIESEQIQEIFRR